MIAFGIIACSMPEVFADYPQRHLLATSWALCFRKIYVYHIIIFVCLRSNYECKDTSFFCFSQIFFYLSQSVCEIFPCQCNHSLTRSSRHASCHLFYYLIIYSRSCCIACLVVLQPYVYRSRQQLYSNRRAIFSCRTHLYRIFKTKEGCSPTEWRDFHSTDAAQNDAN